jgi:serine/threonine-protein kinase
METGRIGRLESPIQFGRYTLLERIGIGGMAEIFRARLNGPDGFQKIVVIKRALPHLAQDKLGVRMFVEEAKLAASISHDGIAQVLELGQSPDGEWFIVMEHVDGIDLSKLLVAAEHRALRMPPWLSVHVAAEVLDALAHVHELADGTGAPLGVVHRDVTPSNVIASYFGRIKLSDFGIAKFSGKSPTTMAGQLKGKPSYMSPEQLDNTPLDARSDLFTVGIWLWECLTQRKLFVAKDHFALVLEIAEGKRRAPSEVAADVPRTLDRLVLKALSTSPDDRFPSAREMRAALLGELAVMHPNIGREHVATAMAALLGRIEPTKDISVSLHVPNALRDTSFVFALQEPTPPMPPPAPRRPPPPPPPTLDEEDDLDTLTGRSLAPPLYLRRRGKGEFPLYTLQLALEKLFELGKDGVTGELSTDRNRWMRTDDFAQRAGIDLGVSDAMLASNITIVGNIATRSIMATLAVLSRDRATGTLAVARTDPLSGEWYELTIRDGLLVRVMTNVPEMQLPLLAIRENLVEADEALDVLGDIIKKHRTLDQLLTDRLKRRIDPGWLSRLRLEDLFRWTNADYTFNTSTQRSAEQRTDAPIFRDLHQVIARAYDPATLRAHLRDRAPLRLSRSWRFDSALREIQLDREEGIFAERLASGNTIESALKTVIKSEDAHRFAAIAFLLLEADLLLTGSAWE